MIPVAQILTTLEPPLYRMYVGRFFSDPARPPSESELFVLSFAELLPKLGVLSDEQRIWLLQLFYDRSAELITNQPLMFVLVEHTHALLPGLLPLDLRKLEQAAELPPHVKTEAYNLTQLVHINRTRRWKGPSSEQDAGSAEE